MAGIRHWKTDGMKDIIRASVGRVMTTSETFVFYLGSDISAATGQVGSCMNMT